MTVMPSMERPKPSVANFQAGLMEQGQDGRAEMIEVGGKIIEVQLDPGDAGPFQRGSQATDFLRAWT